METQQIQGGREIQHPNVNNDNFRNLFPDTIYGFINFITQDENGVITQIHDRFNDTLHTIYYYMTPEHFYNHYISFINMLPRHERWYRNFLHGYQNETVNNCIQRIFNKTRGEHANIEDNRDPRFIFVLNIWLELWRH